MTATKGKKTRGNKRVPIPLESVKAADDIWRQNPELIRQFLGIRHDYEQLCAEVEYILRKKIAGQNIETSSITSRAKTLNSFLEKLQRKHYDAPFTQLTDLAGVRVVCLYRSDIAKVTDIIRSDFVVVEDVDKTSELRVDQFGYGARHFIVRLGKTSSGARYDDLKQLVCEIQVRTVVQDAWAIIQHHMVYKRESQVPSQLQRKLNSLAGLFETVDDQFERIREDREAYVVELRGSADTGSAFLENELNLDSFKEYLTWRFPKRAIEAFGGQARMVLDGLTTVGCKTLRHVEDMVKKTDGARGPLLKALETDANIRKADDGTVPSNLEVALALTLSSRDWAELVPWGQEWEAIIRKHLKEQNHAG